MAVQNALPAVKNTADLVTRGDHGAGVCELIEAIIADDLAHTAAGRRHRILLGAHYSRWFRDAIKDEELADAAAEIEAQAESGAHATRERMKALVTGRYAVSAKG